MPMPHAHTYRFVCVCTPTYIDLEQYIRTYIYNNVHKKCSSSVTRSDFPCVYVRAPRDEHYIRVYLSHAGQGASGHAPPSSCGWACVHAFPGPSPRSGRHGKGSSHACGPGGPRSRPRVPVPALHPAEPWTPVFLKGRSYLGAPGGGTQGHTSDRDDNGRVAGSIHSSRLEFISMPLWQGRGHRCLCLIHAGTSGPATPPPRARCTWGHSWWGN